MNDFFLPGDDVEKVYAWLREHRNNQDIRDALSRMWTRYSPYCPESDFLFRAQRDFYAMVWQMQLATLLLDHGFSLDKVESEGPDICVLHKGQRLWIETTAVRAGYGPDAVRNLVGVGAVPDKPILLRIRSAIESKFSQHRNWLSNSDVENDPFIIAINYGLVPQADLHDGVCNADKVLFGVGDFQWTVSIDSGETIDTGYTHRPVLVKQSGAQVTSNVFLDSKYSRVSAVISTPHHFLNTWSMEGRDIATHFNPLASRPLNLGLLPFGKESWVEGDFLRRRNITAAEEYW